MKEYIAPKVSSKLKIDDDTWDKVPAAELSEGWWDIFPVRYPTVARLVHCDEGLVLRMETAEWPITVKTMRQNCEVCLDSCMEFFVTPNTRDKDYMNIEVSAAAVPLCYVGNPDEKRRALSPVEEGVEFRTLIEFKRGWMLYVFIPYSFLRKYFSVTDKEMRANFCKCGDKTVWEHYAVWNKIETPQPVYHLPEYFGKIVLSDEYIS